MNFLYSPTISWKDYLSQRIAVFLRGLSLAAGSFFLSGHCKAGRASNKRVAITQVETLRRKSGSKKRRPSSRNKVEWRNRGMRMHIYIYADSARRKSPASLCDSLHNARHRESRTERRCTIVSFGTTVTKEAACGKFRKLFPVSRRNHDIELKSNNAGKFVPTFLRAIGDKTPRLFRNFIDLWDSDDE